MMLFVIAPVFLGAVILFVIEPIFPKLLLPQLGGSHIVWDTCLVFYQTALLAGYAYSHYATKRIPPFIQRAIQVGLVVLMALHFSKDIRMVAGWSPSGSPGLWVFTTAIISIGAPIFLLSTTTPMISRWFAESAMGKGRDPYFLYAISNAGSIIVLLVFPLYIEVHLNRSQQISLVSAGMWVFVVSLIAAAIVTARGVKAEWAEAEGAETKEKVTLRQMARWVALAFLPSSLLVGITDHITSDIAAIPFLWVLPLAVYLLTFILAFSVSKKPPGRVLLALQGIALMTVGILNWAATKNVSSYPTAAVISVHLLVFFVMAYGCHKALAGSRPSAGRLTEFYLAVAIGGALGGGFNALVIPIIFNRVIEYPLALALAYLLIRPDAVKRGKQLKSYWPDAAIPALLCGVLFLMPWRADSLQPGSWNAVVAAMSVFLLLVMRRPLAFALCVLVIVGFGVSYKGSEYYRSYYGSYRVEREKAKDRTLLYSGSVLHGFQYSDAARRREPQTYYSKEEPFGVVYGRYSGIRRPESVAVIGLGAGSMAAYSEPGQRWVFFEIDPLVKLIAQDTSKFTYLSDSRAEVRVSIGDGRILMSREKPASFDVIVVDAFSGDAIPVHMLTREAVEVYSSRLRDGGIIMFHLSNSYMKLGRVVGKIAEAEGLDSLFCSTDKSVWFVLSKENGPVKAMGEVPHCKHVPVMPGDPLWTDDYASVFETFYH